MCRAERFERNKFLKFLFFQSVLEDEDCVKQLKAFSLDGPDGAEGQVNYVDQRRPGHRSESQVSSPLDRIKGWPRGGLGYPAAPWHTSALTNRKSGKRSSLV